jgi:hypothetical protein
LLVAAVVASEAVVVQVVYFIMVMKLQEPIAVLS